MVVSIFLGSQEGIASFNWQGVSNDGKILAVCYSQEMMPVATTNISVDGTMYALCSTNYLLMVIPASNLWVIFQDVPDKEPTLTHVADNQ